MELLLGLLWLAGISFAVNKAWQHVRSEYRKSRGAHAKQAATEKKHPAPRRHAAAWWTREARYGFPVTRAGFTHGWQAHQTALEQTRARREEARTSHLEARASIAEEMHAHRQRQENAWNLIWHAHERDQQQPPVEGDELAAKRAAKDTPPPLPADTVQPRAAAPAAAPAPQEGTPMATATDTNYTESMRMAKEVEAEADAAVNDIRWQQMANQVDAIGALMRGDTATLSDASDVADALAEQKKAMEKTRDSASAFANGLQRRHGGIKEAHDDAPVPAAESEFYED